MTTTQTWKPSAALSVSTISAAMDLVIPIWLELIASKLMAAAKAIQPRFGSKTRKFWFNVDTGKGAISLNQANVFCEGNYVETTAWDYEFNVPSGGFKYGDIDPLTGQPFPGGRGKGNITYITLVNKPEVEGENVKAVARTYSKYSGQRKQYEGFFDAAIRKEFGAGESLTSAGKSNLQSLAYMIGREVAVTVANSIAEQGRAMGYTVSVSNPIRITEGSA
jgi:hypothetical protein